MDTQLQADYRLMKDFWTFWKLHDDVKPPDNDGYWETLLIDGDAFVRDHPEPFARVLIVALMKELERRVTAE